MQSRALPSSEEGKDPATNTSRTNHHQSRVLPLRLLQVFGLFLALCVAFSVVSLYMIKRQGYGGVSTTSTSMQSSFKPCYEEVGGLDRWIVPPRTLIHKMNDTELFWRASFVPKIKTYPFQRVPKIAFMFLTKGPLPLAPLWERFLKGHEGLYSIYIHSTPSYRPGFPAKSVFYMRQIPSKVAEWGRMSICDAERRLLANALLDISNERFVLLSESCIPLFNFSYIYDYVMGSKHSFVGSFDDPGPFGRGRYDENMKPEVNISQWRKGAQWFEVRRRHAVSIIEDTRFYRKFEEFCRPACYVDEHYFPTMLTILSGEVMANRSLTWVDWSRGGAHPATFGKEDMTEEFLRRVVSNQKCLYNGQPSSTCFLFARKFAPSALGPLLYLARKHLGY